MNKFLVKTGGSNILLSTDYKVLTKRTFNSMLYWIETFTQIDRETYSEPIKVDDNYNDKNALLVTVTKDDVKRYNKFH